MTVMACEMLVDWLKHAFITKFNHIRPSVYERYTDVLCLDLSSGSAVGRLRARKVRVSGYIDVLLSLKLAQHSYVDQSPLVARRLGFAAIPLAVLAILVGAQSINLVFSLNSDFTYPWTWTVRSLSQAEVVYYATWTIVGLLSWLWWVTALPLFIEGPGV